MGIIRKQSIQTSIAIGLGVLVSYFHVLWILPYCLETKEIGLVRVLVSGGSLLATFIPLGVQNTTVRFFPFFENRMKGHYGFLLYALGMPILGGALVLAITLLFKGRIIEAYSDSSPLVVDYFPFFLGLGLVIAYQRVLISYSRALLQAVLPNFLRNLVLRLLTATAVLLYFADLYGRDGLVLAYLMAYVLIVLVLLSYVTGMGQLHIAPSRFKIPFSRIQEMFKFGLFAMFTATGNVVLRSIDTLMLGAMTDLENTGIYFIAMSIGTLIEVPKRAVIQISSPMLAKARQKEDLEEIEGVYKKSSINQLLAGSLIFILVWSNIDALFDIIPKGDILQEGKWVVFMIGGARLIDMITGVNGQIIMNSRFYRVNFYIMSTLILLVILLNYFLIPALALNGAALATLLALATTNIMKTVFLWWKEGIHPFSLNSMKALIAILLTFFIGVNIPQFLGPWGSIILRSLVVTLFLGGLSYAFRISEDGSELLDKWFRKLKE